MKFLTLVGNWTKMAVHIVPTTMKIHVRLNKRRQRKAKGPWRKRRRRERKAKGPARKIPKLVSFEGNRKFMHWKNKILTEAIKTCSSIWCNRHHPGATSLETSEDVCDAAVVDVQDTPNHDDSKKTGINSTVESSDEEYIREDDNADRSHVSEQVCEMFHFIPYFVQFSTHMLHKCNILFHFSTILFVFMTLNL